MLRRLRRRYRRLRNTQLEFTSARSTTARSTTARSMTARHVGRGVEIMEPRLLLSIDPVFVGAVYIEEDLGNDLHGDTIQINFQGGAPGTQLTQLAISGDQNLLGFNVGDVFFDTETGGLGADAAFPIRIEAQQGIDFVHGTVRDGTSDLLLEFEGFDAGETLVLSIDVDEVEEFDPDQADLEVLNEGFDPITSGVEFQGSTMRAILHAPHFRPAEALGTFVNRYDDEFAGTGLELPGDDAHGKRDRTAGSVAQVQQELIPASIGGHVYHDRNQNGQRDANEEGIGGVTIEAVPIETLVAQTTITTQTNQFGEYQFDGLSPGSYRLVEIDQPDGFLDGLDAAGTVGGVTNGFAINPGDSIEEIQLAGGSHGIDYDFGEIQPVSITGSVHLAGENGDCFSEEIFHAPIAGALVWIEDVHGNVVAETFSADDGTYQFTGLAPGIYTVVEVTPEGLFDGGAQAGTVDGLTRGQVESSGRIAQISLASGEQGVRYDFCEQSPVTISGRVHLSAPDGDCFEQTVDTRFLANVIVRLLDESGREIAQTRTNQAGRYQFLDLEPGAYSVVEVTPQGLIDGAAHLGTIDGVTVGEIVNASHLADIRLDSGEQAVNYDFCEHEPSSLSGFVYHDRNNDGVRDAGEEGIDEVGLVLLDSAGRTVARTSTDAAGFYEFHGLLLGAYAIRETQPEGWIDGIDSPGSISGRAEGQATNPGDLIANINLQWSESGHDFNFGELRPASIAGIVHTDLNADCFFQENERPLGGIRVELLNEADQVVAVTTTQPDGRFRFTNLAPGTYTLREIQPSEYFHGGQRAGNGGGDDSLADLIRGITVGSADAFVDYAFCEEPPSQISGFVFQDGPAIPLDEGQSLPDDLSTIRNGLLTPDDRRLGQVVLELRDGITGVPLSAATHALPGTYGSGPITTTSDASGFYQFVGLRKGNYAVYQIQPAGYIDGIDTGGTLPSVAVNRHEEIEPEILASLEEDPHFDAIIRIALPPGQSTELNNFSEVITQSERLIVPFDGPDSAPIPPAHHLTLPIFPSHPVIVEPLEREVTKFGHSQSAWAHTWHLSIIGGGQPRGDGQIVSPRGPVWFEGTQHHIAWFNDSADELKWTLLVTDGEAIERRFGVAGGLPITGDFDGDGLSEIGVFSEGQWFIDLDGDGKWDREDLWAKLGHQGDLPVTGDWDGDGKDDIGIYGLAWPGDPIAVDREPGLPDHDSESSGKRKNVPPAERDAIQGRRELRRTADGETRSDVIDHVFHYGAIGDHPVSGDWNGDGVHTVGVFHKGVWHLDQDGNGEFTDADTEAEFGQAGDFPIVGDFNGDGVDEIAVYRQGVIIMDTNRNLRIDSEDLVVSVPRGRPVVGDWNGDGWDDVGVVERAMRFAEIDSRE